MEGCGLARSSRLEQYSMDLRHAIGRISGTLGTVCDKAALSETNPSSPLLANIGGIPADPTIVLTQTAGRTPDLHRFPVPFPKSFAHVLQTSPPDQGC